jgi:hypothetical protein
MIFLKALEFEIQPRGQRFEDKAALQLDKVLCSRMPLAGIGERAVLGLGPGIAGLGTTAGVCCGKMEFSGEPRVYYGWIGQQSGSGFSDRPPAALGVFASSDRL